MLCPKAFACESADVGSGPNSTLYQVLILGNFIFLNRIVLQFLPSFGCSGELGNSKSTLTIIKGNAKWYYSQDNNRNNPGKTCSCPPHQLAEVDNFQVKRTLKPHLICKHPRLYEDYPGDSSH